MSTPFIEIAAAWVLRASWQAGALAIVVGLLCQIFRRMPAAMRSCLWGIVLVRLLLPGVPPAAMSLYNLGRLPIVGLNGNTGRSSAASTSSQAEFHGAPANQAKSTSKGIVESNLVGTPDGGAIATEDVAIRLWLLGAAVWTVGAIVMLGREIASTLRLRGLLRRCRTACNEPAVAVLDACRKEAGLRRSVDLLLTRERIAPAVTGIFFPRILVCEQTLGFLTPKELRFLFRHELAHVRRWDLLTQQLWRMARAIHWFNPLVWWSIARMRLEAELACDESV